MRNGNERYFGGGSVLSTLSLFLGSLPRSARSRVSEAAVQIRFAPPQRLSLLHRVKIDLFRYKMAISVQWSIVHRADDE